MLTQIARDQLEILLKKQTRSHHRLIAIDLYIKSDK